MSFILDGATEVVKFYPRIKTIDPDGNEDVYREWAPGDPTIQVRAHVAPSGHSQNVVQGESFTTTYRVLFRALPDYSNHGRWDTTDSWDYGFIWDDDIYGKTEIKWSRALWRGKKFDVLQEPSFYNRGTYTRHWSLTMRERQ